MNVAENIKRKVTRRNIHRTVVAFGVPNRSASRTICRRAPRLAALGVTTSRNAMTAVLFLRGPAPQYTQPPVAAGSPLHRYENSIKSPKATPQGPISVTSRLIAACLSSFRRFEGLKNARRPNQEHGHQPS